MHLFHHQQVAAHEEGKEDNKDVKHHGPDHMCPHCGRKLMERGGLLHMWQPISNAFVLNGHCLACHSDEMQAEEAEKTKAEEEEKKEEEHHKQEHEVRENSEEDEYTDIYYSLFSSLDNALHFAPSCIVKKNSQAQ
jgi:hypothetical protein